MDEFPQFDEKIVFLDVFIHDLAEEYKEGKIKSRYFDMDLLPLLQGINPGDNNGWAIFDLPTWNLRDLDTLGVFEKPEYLLSK